MARRGVPGRGGDSWQRRSHSPYCASSPRPSFGGLAGIVSGNARPASPTSRDPRKYRPLFAFPAAGGDAPRQRPPRSPLARTACRHHEPSAQKPPSSSAPTIVASASIFPGGLAARHFLRAPRARRPPPVGASTVSISSLGQSRRARKSPGRAPFTVRRWPSSRRGCRGPRAWSSDTRTRASTCRGRCPDTACRRCSTRTSPTSSGH